MTTIIIGGGAGGLACAIRLKQRLPKAQTVVLERLEAPGRKILATGNGRCNFSNRKAEHSLEVVEFFRGIGLVEREDEDGRLYPYSNRADTVLDVLLKACDKLGVEIINGFEVERIDDGLCVFGGGKKLEADNIVVATGGKAQKSLGSNGSGYKLLRSIGHTVTPLSPALVQLTSSSKYPRALKGQRFKCNMSILLDGETACEDYGEVLFTDYGLSGIVTMNLSRAAAENFSLENPQKCATRLDLIPEMSVDELEAYLKRFGDLQGILGARLADIIKKQSQGDILKTAQIAKNWQLIITGTKGYDFAQITSGGVPLCELDFFESKKLDNVYAVGEVLDVQYECGGFNLNFAFYSGIAVADKIADKYENRHI